MEQDEFTALVERLTEDCRLHPTAYRRRVGGFVALGYAGIAGMLLLAVAFTVGAVALLFAFHGLWLLKIVWIPVVFGFVILKSLWIEFPPPTGLPLEPATSPELFEALDDICAAVDAPRPHRVLGTREFNAGITQVPRLGLLGWHRDYLALGLPMMQALSREQFRAVLAHELGHLSRSHGVFAHRVAAMRSSWVRLHAELEQGEHVGQGFVRHFLDWYAPRLEARASVLARAQEHEADRAAAAATSREATVSALARIEVVDRFLSDEFWPAVHRRAMTDPEPPRSVFADLGRALEQPMPPEKAAAWLAATRVRKTDVMDTHPSFGARLGDLGLEPAEVEAAAQTGPSAAGLLGAALPTLIQDCDAEWWVEVLHHWRVHHHQAAQARARLAELRERGDPGDLSIEERRDQIRLAMDLGECSAARADVDRLLAAHPDDSWGLYMLGQLLLQEDDEHGLERLERAMELDRDTIVPSCNLAVVFLERHGRVEDAARYRTRAQEHGDLLQRATAERQALAASDRFEPHALAAESLADVVSALRTNPEVACAFLVRKPVSLLPDVPHHVLVVVPRLPGLHLDRRARYEALAHWLDENVPVPGTKVVSVLDDDPAGLRDALEAVPGSRVYSGR